MARTPAKRNPQHSPRGTSQDNTPGKNPPRASASTGPAGSNRDKIIAAFMALLADQRIEDIGFADIAARAGVSLADLRQEFGSKLAILAANINAAGPKGVVRAQGVALLFARVLHTFVDDDDPGLARTMAALDRALARGQRWSSFLDDLCCLATGRRCLSPFRRRSDADLDRREEPMPI